MSKNHFEIGEWYHCYNRGVDKRTVYLDKTYYERFLALLYLCNDSESPTQISNLRGPTLMEILNTDHENTLVDIGCYCLMPNHYHLLLREKIEGGITQFIRRLSTGYTMYFNIRNDRTGPLFGGTFKSKHVGDELYFKRVFNYIHANSAELIEPNWKLGIFEDEDRTANFLTNYPYSSLPDYLGVSRAQAKIINMEEILDYYENNEAPKLRDLFDEACDFADIEVRP